MLNSKFEAESSIVKQATKDIDTTINVPLELDSIIDVGEDVDLLVLQAALSTQSNIYIICIVDKTVEDHILILYAFSGCDTTCVRFIQRKFKFINVLRNNQHLSDFIQLIKNPPTDTAGIAKARERLLLKLYGYSIVKSGSAVVWE